MSIAANYNIVVEQHSDWEREFQIKQGGVVKDITGFTFTAQIRERTQSSTSYDFTGAIVDATDGEFKLTMTDTLTATIPAGDYVWDLVQTDDSGVKTRLLQGKCSVTAGVTR